MKDNCMRVRSKYDTVTSMVKEYGVDYLSNENLLAAIIGIDPMRQGNEPIRQIFDGSHSLRKASKKTLQDLTSIKGIGEQKATALLCAFELAKRLMKEKAQEIVDIGCSLAIYNYMLPTMMDLEHEEMHLLCMDHNFKLKKAVRLSTGGITETALDVRILVKEACMCNASIIALVHNHPSCNCTPSKADDVLTCQVAKVCELMRIFLMDHVIISSKTKTFYSYHDRGKL